MIINLDEEATSTKVSDCSKDSVDWDENVDKLSGRVPIEVVDVPPDVVLY